jgi:hypothetical protein
MLIQVFALSRASVACLPIFFDDGEPRGHISLRLTAPCVNPQAGMPSF